MSTSAHDPEDSPLGEQLEALRNELALTKDKLEECGRLRDIVFSVIGHDLRAPVAQLNAILYLFREMRGEGVSEERRDRFILDLEHSKDQLLRTLDNLLQWSRGHHRHFAPEFFEITPEDLVAEAVAANRADAALKEIEIVLTSSAGESLSTDPGLAGFILRNLLANAIKFSPFRGKVVLEDTVSDGRYRCTVADSGKGLSAEQIASLEAGQGGVSTPGTAGERGVGLGLQVCHLFASQLGGRLSFASEVDKGTRATIDIPFAPPPQGL